MKKKQGILLLAAFMLTGISRAQAQNPECLTQLSIYAEHVKIKNYDAAYEPWKIVYETCPELNKANFLYGEKILAYKIENTSGEDKDRYIQNLMNLYDNSLRYFPTTFTTAGVAIDKALLLYDQKMASDEQVYTLLDKAFKEDHKNFKNPKALYLYFSSLVNLHKAGKKELQEVFDTYDNVAEKIEEENQKLTDIINTLLPKDSLGTLTSKEKSQLKAANTNSESYGKITAGIDAKLGVLADCNNLIPLYQKSYEAKKDDLQWVKRAVSRMFAKECTDDPMFQKLFETQLALDPSPEAYLYGGTLKQKAGDYTAAISDFNKAAALESNPHKKSNILYKIATIIHKNSKVQARSYALKAITANPSNGKAYLLIATLYANSANDCGSTPFEKRALYWKAAEMAQKAGRVDPSLHSSAARAVASYQAKAPSKEMIFNSGMAGKSITFDCWVGGKVTVPSL